MRLGEALGQLLQVILERAVERPDPADVRRLGRGSVERGLDLVLGVVVELESVAREQLDAVVLVGVVRRRDHRREVKAVAAHQQRRRRRREHAGEPGIATRRSHPGGDRGLEHLARLARVADDQDLRTLRFHPRHRSTGQREREVGRQEMSRPATDAVRAEQLARHNSHRRR